MNRKKNVLNCGKDEMEDKIPFLKEKENLTKQLMISGITITI